MFRATMAQRERRDKEWFIEPKKWPEKSCSTSRVNWKTHLVAEPQPIGPGQASRWKNYMRVFPKPLGVWG